MNAGKTFLKCQHTNCFPDEKYENNLCILPALIYIWMMIDECFVYNARVAKKNSFQVEQLDLNNPLASTN